MAIKGSGKVLVDTSAWIDYFRKKEPAHGVVSGLMSENRICCVGIVLAELMQGAKSEKELDVIKDFVHVFEFLPENIQLWKQAGELSFSLRRSGAGIGLADCFIATITAHYGVSLYTFDKDFTAVKESLHIDFHGW